MKISVSLLLTDILPKKRRLINKVLKNKFFDNKELGDVFLDLKKKGLDGVEILLPSSVKLDDLDNAKKILASAGLSVLSVHQSLRFLTKTKTSEVEDIFRCAKLLNAGVIVLHMSSIGRQVFDQKYIDSIHNLEKKHKIKAGFENREKYFASLSSPHGWHEKAFPALMKKNKFSITFDVQHLAQSGGDIIAFFNQNKKEIVNVHISDYKSNFLNSSLRPLRFKHLPLGKGELPIDEFVKQLKKANYEGMLTLEIKSDYDGLCESLEIIKKNL